MKIGIVGSGNVGGALGSRWAKLGHEVVFGTRHPGSGDVQKLAARASGKTSAATLADAAREGEVLLLATPWLATQEILAGLGDLKGKILIDATNPLIFAPKGLELALGHTDSAGEQVQRWLPSAHVVKAFNIVGYAHMFKPDFPGGPPDMFICGNDAGAKHTVTEILKDFGWPTIDIGGIKGSRLLEPMCVLWVGYAMSAGNGNHAFKLLRK